MTVSAALQRVSRDAHEDVGSDGAPPGAAPALSTCAAGGATVGMRSGAVDAPLSGDAAAPSCREGDGKRFLVDGEGIGLVDGDGRGLRPEPSTCALGRRAEAAALLLYMAVVPRLVTSRSIESTSVTPLMPRVVSRGSCSRSAVAPSAAERGGGVGARGAARDGGSALVVGVETGSGALGRPPALRTNESTNEPPVVLV